MRKVGGESPREGERKRERESTPYITKKYNVKPFYCLPFRAAGLTNSKTKTISPFTTKFLDGN